MKNDDGRKSHPTQKPEALLHRIIVGTTNPGDVILDPFFGTGTTGAVAKLLGRHFIGLERDEDYVDVATRRIENVRALGAEDIEVQSSKKAEPRVPFGALVEHGLVRPGDRLFCPQNRHVARVRADGSHRQRRSHRLDPPHGRACRMRRSCNGWTFWHYKSDSGLAPSTCCAASSARRWASRPSARFRPPSSCAWSASPVGCVNAARPMDTALRARRCP